LAALLVHHGLHSEFNICLAHKHFQLFSPSEKVVQLYSVNGLSVSSVFKDGAPDPAIVRQYNLHVPEVPSIVPATFFIDRGTMVPYEFRCVERGSAEQLYMNKAGMIKKEFLESWSRIVTEIGIDDGMGLAVRGNYDNSPDPALMLQKCNPHLRVDVRMKWEDKAPGSYTVAAVWEVREVDTDQGSTIVFRPLEFCDLEWTCDVCGTVNSGGSCGRCGAQR
jgi:hypothetical protein